MDDCLYLLEYKSADFTLNAGNDQISNFKKCPCASNNGELYYKGEAIKDFSTQLNELLTCIIKKEAFLLPIPTSKKRNDDCFDDRLEQVMNNVVDNNKKIQSMHNLIANYPCIKFSGNPEQRRGDRDLLEFKREIEINRIDGIDNITLVLLEDMITTGLHFRAYSDKIKESYPNISIKGIFWARRVWNDF